MMVSLDEAEKALTPDVGCLQDEDVNRRFLLFLGMVVLVLFLASLLAPYIKTPAVFKCPSDESPFVRSVSMNCRLNPARDLGVSPRWLGGPGSKYKVFRRLNEIQNPAMIFVVLDENPDSINDGLFQMNMTRNTWSDIAAALHNGGGSLSFADGHAEVHKWRDDVTKLAVTKGSCPAYGKTSPNDYLWLQQRTSALK